MFDKSFGGRWSRRPDGPKAGRTRGRAAAIRQRRFVEPLEVRTLLSAIMPDLIREPSLTPAAATAAVAGYSPSQIEQAYGFNQISLAQGSVPADGAGETIAIVDSNNDPNIVGDLKVFDSEFSLPAPPIFAVVNQAGGKTLPATDAGWSSEIALDVEWSHAIAPAAKILLVEANSSDTSDLMAAVDYARHVAGVSVVSMSWGGSEFFDWGNGGESQSQTAFDPIFTTPAGHAGVTFVAAAGDSGAQSGVQWPASSPNVLSVGGTSLGVADNSGTYGGELGWSGTSGGYSQVEVQPTYQNGVQSTGTRSVPDVAYDADPNTGVAIYDSVALDGSSGWQVFGGTSAGAPQWAALVAITDQARALTGRGSLDGATQTLPALYSLYADPGTAAYSSTYTNDFNDVLSGGSGGHRFRWGGVGFGNSATTGYDLVTGLGTPHAAALVAALAPGSSTVSPPSSGGGGDTPSPSGSSASPLSVSFVTPPAANAVAGSIGFTFIRLTNVSGSLFRGPLTLTLYASSDGTVSSADPVLKTITFTHGVLRAGGASRPVRINFDYPSSLADGNYFLVASVTATNEPSSGGSNTPASAAAATAASNSTVAIAQPIVDLSVTSDESGAITVIPGRENLVRLTVENLGNVTANGPWTISVYASTDTTVDASDPVLLHVTTRVLHFRPGVPLALRLLFKAPANLSSGTYNIIATITAATSPADANPANNTAVIATAPPVA